MLSCCTQEPDKPTIYYHVRNMPNKEVQATPQHISTFVSTQMQAGAQYKVFLKQVLSQQGWISHQ